MKISQRLFMHPLCSDEENLNNLFRPLTHQVIRRVRMQPPDLNEAALTSKVHVQVLGDGGFSYSVGRVRTDQKRVVQIQQLDVKADGFFPLQRKRTGWLR